MVTYIDSLSLYWLTIPFLLKSSILHVWIPMCILKFTTCSRWIPTVSLIEQTCLLFSPLSACLIFLKSLVFPWVNGKSPYAAEILIYFSHVHLVFPHFFPIFSWHPWPSSSITGYHRSASVSLATAGVLMLRVLAWPRPKRARSRWRCCSSSNLAMS